MWRKTQSKSRVEAEVSGAAGLSLFFSLDERSARLLVEKCFAPATIEKAFNLRSCDGPEDSWCYKVQGESDGRVVSLPRRFDGNVGAVSKAIKDMAAILSTPPMFMLIALVSGAACINTQLKMEQTKGKQGSVAPPLT